jgi:hypothetical protein
MFRFDPDLTAIVAAFKEGDGLNQALQLAPIVRPPRSFKYPTYAAGAIYAADSDIRAPGDPKVKVTTVPVQTLTTVFIPEHSRAGFVDIQTQDQPTAIQEYPENSIRARIKLISKFLNQRMLYEIATLAQTASYKATPTTKWNASGADPEWDIKTACEAFVKKSGVEPNIIAFASNVVPWCSKGLRATYGINAPMPNVQILTDFLTKDLNLGGLGAKPIFLPSFYNDGTNFVNLFGDSVFLANVQANPTAVDPTDWLPSFLNTAIPKETPADIFVMPPKLNDMETAWICKVTRYYIPVMPVDAAGYMIYTTLG